MRAALKILPLLYSSGTRQAAIFYQGWMLGIKNLKKMIEKAGYYDFSGTHAQEYFEDLIIKDKTTYYELCDVGAKLTAGKMQPQLEKNRAYLGTGNAFRTSSQGMLY